VGLAAVLVRDVRVKFVRGVEADAVEVAALDRDFIVVDHKGKSFDFIRAVSRLIFRLS